MDKKTINLIVTLILVLLGTYVLLAYLASQGYGATAT